MIGAMLIAVLGATGFTGELVLRRGRELGLPLRLVGRNEESLAALTGPGEAYAVAAARVETALGRAFDGATVVASCAGPFLELGDAPVRVAIALGAHYLDTSGEQAFARLVYERHDEPARDRGVALLTSFGFDYVPGDLAARLAAADLEPVDEIAVAYAVQGVATSSGTRRTMGRVMRQPLAAFANGRLVDSHFGATTRRVQFPFGERDVVEWGGTEPLTVPRHTDVQNVRSYLRASKVVARAGRLARAAAPLVRLTASVGRGPDERSRAKSRFAVVAEATSASAGRRVTLTGSDPYGLTALLIARGAQALAAGEVRGAGARGPAEAFDARELIGDLEPLIRVDSEIALV
jgi:short subunit dehydrogenase-like uncharacterized protein